MAYGVKYICEFDRVTDLPYPSYTFQILQKDYSGNAIRLHGGASVVIHRWDTDDPIAPIKGSSLEITLINESQFPLLNIYSNNDEEFKAKLIWHYAIDVVMFEGFVVQDDCSELMVDYNHEVTVAANDNLGLLKDVPLNKAAAGYNLLFISTEQYEITQSGGDSILLVSLGYGSTVMVGDKISIDGGVQHEVASILKGGTVYNLYLAVDTASVASTTGELSLYRNALDNILTLLMIIKRCLSATGLELQTRVFSNINESTVTENTVCFLEQTLIDPATFLKNDNEYDDCYTVLEKVLARFNCTLFQAKGAWNIVRWPEARTYDYDVPGHLYDSNFVLDDHKIYLDGRLTLDEVVEFAGFPKFFVGINEHSVPETGLISRIQRPFEFTKETFNYKQPEELLRNASFTKLGVLRQTYTTGTGDDLQTISEYEMLWWYPGFTWTSGGSAILYHNPDRFIRVIKDNLDVEIERYGVIKGASTDDPASAASYRIEVSAGDVIRYSFSFRSSNSDPGPNNIIFDINLVTQLPLAPRGANNRYLDDDGTWDTTRGLTHQVPNGDNSNNWQSVEVTSDRIPFDGQLFIKLAQASSNNTETHYRDLRLEITSFINQSTKIIGHTHDSEHSIEIKNNNEREIFVDSSPRNSIAGTLYLNELDGILQKRTRLWKTFSGAAMNLGRLTTFENLMLRKEARTILEGNFYGLISTIEDRPFIHDHVSLLSVVKYNHFLTRNFIFGRLEIDYRNNTFNGTLFEVYKDNEADSDLAYSYTFEFLYDSR